MDNFEPNNLYNLDVENNFVDEDNSELVGRLIRGRRDKKSLQEITGCKRPLVMAGKKKRAYNECMDAYKASISAKDDAVAQAELKTAQAQEEANVAKQQLAEAKSPTPTEGGATKQATDLSGAGDSSDGKILGMPKGLAIGLGIAVLALGTFITIKIIRARKKG